MKALKNESTIFVSQIVDRINICYENSNPTNMELMDLYSFIGKSICEQGEKAFVVYLAEILSETLPSTKGFSPRNLRRMRDFYITYQTEPMLMKKAKELSWTQNTVILECCENNEQRSFYLALAEENNLSTLQHHRQTEKAAGRGHQRGFTHHSQVPGLSHLQLSNR